jgi:hypothetical protein
VGSATEIYGCLRPNAVIEADLTLSPRASFAPPTRPCRSAFSFTTLFVRVGYTLGASMFKRTEPTLIESLIESLKTSLSNGP